MYNYRKLFISPLKLMSKIVWGLGLPLRRERGRENQNILWAGSHYFSNRFQLCRICVQLGGAQRDNHLVQLVILVH